MNDKQYRPAECKLSYTSCGGRAVFIKLLGVRKSLGELSYSTPTWSKYTVSTENANPRKKSFFFLFNH